MFRITLKTDLPQKLQQASQQLDKLLPSLLQQIGVFLSAEQKFSFEDKSRGGSGADGKSWKPLTATTEFLKQTRYISKSRKKDESGFTDKQKASALKRRGRMRAKLKAKMGPLKRSQIGVDRGLLRNSGNQGFRPSDGKGGNLNRLELNGKRLVLEYGRSYATHFDAIRPLFPTTTPAAWSEGVDKIVRDWVDGILSGIN